MFVNGIMKYTVNINGFDNPLISGQVVLVRRVCFNLYHADNLISQDGPVMHDEWQPILNEVVPYQEIVLWNVLMYLFSIGRAEEPIHP